MQRVKLSKTAQEKALKMAVQIDRPLSLRQKRAFACSSQFALAETRAAFWKLCVRHLKTSALPSDALYRYASDVLAKGPKSDEVAALEAAAKLKATFSGMAQPEPMTTALDALEGQSIAARLWFNATEVDPRVYLTAYKYAPHLLAYMEDQQQVLDQRIKRDFREASARDFLSHPQAYLAWNVNHIPSPYLTSKKDCAVLRSNARAALTYKGVS